MGEVTKEIWIDAPPEKVYSYLVEPELTVRWFGEESWNDPQAGGLYRVRGVPAKHVGAGRPRRGRR